MLRTDIDLQRAVPLVRRGKGQRKKQANAAKRAAEIAAGAKTSNPAAVEPSSASPKSQTPAAVQNPGAANVDTGCTAVAPRDLFLARIRAMNHRRGGGGGTTGVLPIQSLLVHNVSHRERFYETYFQRCIRDNFRETPSGITVLRKIPLNIDTVFWTRETPKSNERAFVREEVWKNRSLVTAARAIRIHERFLHGDNNNDDGVLSDDEKPLVIRRFGDRPAAAAAAAETAKEQQPRTTTDNRRRTIRAYINAVFVDLLLALVTRQYAEKLRDRALQILDGYSAPTERRGEGEEGGNDGSWSSSQEQTYYPPNPARSISWLHYKVQELVAENCSLVSAAEVLCLRSDLFLSVLFFETTTESSSSNNNVRPPNVLRQLGIRRPKTEGGIDVQGTAMYPECVVSHDGLGNVVRVTITLEFDTE